MVRLISPDLLAFGRDDPGYQEASAVFNLAGKPWPAEAVVARTVEQVGASVRDATAGGRAVRVLSTGHGVLSRGDMDDALLVRASLAGEVRVDPVARTAVVPAGARWEEVVHAAAKHGLVALHGSSPTVGVVGYLLHGGLSFYGRRHGVAANHVRSIELVTAAAELVRVDADHEPELFWALRGGGGGFGIVTEIEIDLFEAAGVWCGALVWPGDRADAVFRAWRDWARSAPREITTSARLLNLPELPAGLTEGPVLAVGGTAVASGADVDAGVAAATHAVAELVERLSAVAEPTLNTWRPASPVETVRTHMDPELPLPIRSTHCLLDELTDDTLDRLLATVGAGSDSPLLVAEVRQLGAAFAEPVAAGGVFDRVGSPWLFYACGVPVEPGSTEAITGRLAAAQAALRDSASTYTAPSFIEDGHQRQRSFDRPTAERVAAIRRRHDPAGLFRGDVAVGATSALAGSLTDPVV